MLLLRIGAKMGANREHKDSVFTWLFSEPDTLRELYSALEGTPLDLSVPISINTLENVIFEGKVNDISFIIADKVVVLIEHQSTINKNMPLRLLMYIADVYKKITGEEDIYHSKLIPIPRPEFIVLYNGIDEYDDEKTLNLSDSFMDASSFGLANGERPPLELTLKVYNINQGRNKSIIAKCQKLEWYSTFIAKIREYQKETGKDKAGTMEAVKRAVRFCIDHDIMKEFLKLHSSEVMNMLVTEWNWDTALRVRGEEGREEGREEAKKEDAKNLLALGVSPDTVAKAIGLSKETIKDLSAQ
jgi:predicted transposase/invertase (TIGR01784 family)